VLTVGVDPRYMGIAPVAAIPKVLAQAGISAEMVDIYEVHALVGKILSKLTRRIEQINEAFASQFAYCVEKLEISMEKINPKSV
jgi:acetyl-CoA acyltransferase 1